MPGIEGLMIIGCAVLSATTFWSSVREFSPLEVCTGETKMAPSGRFREPATGLDPAQ